MTLSVFARTSISVTESRIVPRKVVPPPVMRPVFKVLEWRFVRLIWRPLQALPRRGQVRLPWLRRLHLREQHRQALPHPPYREVWPRQGRSWPHPCLALLRPQVRDQVRLVPQQLRVVQLAPGQRRLEEPLGLQHLRQEGLPRPLQVRRHLDLGPRTGRVILRLLGPRWVRSFWLLSSFCRRCTRGA